MYLRYAQKETKNDECIHNYSEVDMVFLEKFINHYALV